MHDGNIKGDNLNTLYISALLPLFCQKSFFSGNVPTGDTHAPQSAPFYFILTKLLVKKNVFIMLYENLF